MTFSKEIQQKKHTRWGFHGGSAAFGVMLCFCILLFFKSPEIVAGAAQRGLTLCAKSVIPALFPFSVIAGLLLSTGAGPMLIRPLSSLLCPRLQLSEEGCCAMLLGILCGAPIGATSAATAARAGRISSEEAERILLLSGNASPAFLINSVGVSLVGNKRFGVLLFGVVICCQTAVGVLFLLSAGKASPTEKQESREPIIAPAEGFGILFARAVRASCDAMLTVCAFVIFFSVLTGALGAVLTRFSIGKGITALLLCISEPIGGMSAAASLTDPLLTPALCGFCGGWMGLSVHCQILAACNSVPISWGRYLAAKLLQGLLCGLLLTIASLTPSPIYGILAISAALGAVFLTAASIRWRERRSAAPPRRNNRRAYPPRIR
ncbi:MAG: hypothetical protein E7620_08665 [Ruminococcaceae bacterium]|nr:hypothetical protein [Oscillospiraceae bacterium]